MKTIKVLGKEITIKSRKDELRKKVNDIYGCLFSVSCGYLAWKPGEQPNDERDNARNKLNDAMKRLEEVFAELA